MELASDRVWSKTNRGVSRYDHLKICLTRYVPIGSADQFPVFWYYSSSVSVRTLALQVMNSMIVVSTVGSGSGGAVSELELEFLEVFLKIICSGPKVVILQSALLLIFS